ncbi:MAG: hypothetical protein K8R88_07445 [Armatimonadetes bacterium]|nr:hypothetical protein [Armatimonadota bacterium]
MPILALLLGSQLANTVTIVYSARYYKQGTAKSSHQLYLCRHDGSQKKQLTFGSKSCLSPLWLDRKHIAYIEVNEFVPEQSYTETTEPTRFMVLDITTGKSKVLASPSLNYPDPVADQRAKTITVGGFVWKISPTAVTKGAKQSDEIDPLGKEVDDNEQVTFKLPAKGATPGYEFTYKQDLDELDIGKIDLKVKGPMGERTYKLKGSEVEAATVFDSKLYVTTKPRFTKFTCEHFVYTLGETANLVLSDVGWLTFDPSKPIWFATRPDTRALGKLKNGKQVYISGIISGNWQTKKRWTIVDGLALVDSYQVQP